MYPGSDVEAAWPLWVPGTWGLLSEDTEGLREVDATGVEVTAGVSSLEPALDCDPLLRELVEAMLGSELEVHGSLALEVTGVVVSFLDDKEICPKRERFPKADEPMALSKWWVWTDDGDVNGEEEVILVELSLVVQTQVDTPALVVFLPLPKLSSTAGVVLATGGEESELVVTESTTSDGVEEEGKLFRAILGIKCLVFVWIETLSFPLSLAVAPLMKKEPDEGKEDLLPREGRRGKGGEARRWLGGEYLFHAGGEDLRAAEEALAPPPRTDEDESEDSDTYLWGGEEEEEDGADVVMVDDPILEDAVESGDCSRSAMDPRERGPAPECSDDVPVYEVVL